MKQDPLDSMRGRDRRYQAFYRLDKSAWKRYPVRALAHRRWPDDMQFIASIELVISTLHYAFPGMPRLFARLRYSVLFIPFVVFVRTRAGNANAISNGGIEYERRRQ